MSHLKDFHDDCVHIQALAKEMGYDITLEEACAIWEFHSEDYSAGWLVLENDDDVKAVIQYHMPIRNKICPHCGQRLNKYNNNEW